MPYNLFTSPICAFVLIKLLPLKHKNWINKELFIYFPLSGTIGWFIAYRFNMWQEGWTMPADELRGVFNEGMIWCLFAFGPIQWCVHRAILLLELVVRKFRNKKTSNKSTHSITGSAGSE
jgi:vacuolar-type H+-ATPase subunit I/STV1